MNCCAWGSTDYVYRQQWFVVVTKYSDAVIILTLTLFMNWSTARTSLQSQNPGTVPAADAVCNALDSSRRLRLLSRLVRVSRCLQPYLISGLRVVRDLHLHASVGYARAVRWRCDCLC